MYCAIVFIPTALFRSFEFSFQTILTVVSLVQVPAFQASHTFHSIVPKGLNLTV